MSLLQFLEAGFEDDNQDTDSTRELAARAVDLCMAQCPRFPMKVGALDARNMRYYVLCVRGRLAHKQLRYDTTPES